MDGEKLRFQELQAVVMAAGKGSRLMDITTQCPKALLPIGNYPMVWYPLHMLEKSGFQDVILIVSESHKSLIYNTLVNKYNLKIKLELVGIPGSEDLGTADSLRLIAPRVKTDLLIVSCDLITDLPLYKVVDIHRTYDTAVTAMFAPIPQEMIGATVPGHKAKPKLEKDFVGLDPHTSRLVSITSEADLDTSLNIRRSVLKRYPNILLHSKLMDAHLYVMKKWVVDFISDNRNITTIKGELVPYLVKKQFASPVAADEGSNLPPVDSSVLDAEIRNTDIFSYLKNEDSLAKSMSSGNDESDGGNSIRCYGYVVKEGFCIRANNLVGFCEANRQVSRHWPSIAPDITLSYLHPDAKIIQKSQIGSDCMVGEGSELSDKVSIKRSIIGQHCKIGERVKLTNCILMNHVTVHEGVSLTSSILCNNVTVEERAEVKDCIVTFGQTVLKGTKHVNEVMADRDRWLEI